MTDLNVDRLRSVLDYDPETGALRWRSRYTNAIPADMSAGYVDQKGYVGVQVFGKAYDAHRLAWAIHYGQFPAGQIDHINGDRSDNRIVNLRDVPSAENQKNTKIDKRNKSGVSGVRFRADRANWEASIRVSGKLIHLGRFAVFADAVAARKAAEFQHGFHENHGRLVAGKKVER